MASFWGSAFPNQFFSQSYHPWFYDAQGVNYPPVWPLPCYSQYQPPPNAAISALESESSSSTAVEDSSTPSPTSPTNRVPRHSAVSQRQQNGGQQNNGQQRGAKQRKSKNPLSPPANPSQPRSPTRARPGVSLVDSGSAPSPRSPARNQAAVALVAAATPALEYSRLSPSADYTRDLRHYLSHTPSTFSVVSTSTLRRARPLNWRPDYLPPSSSWIKRRLLGLRLVLTDEPSYLNRAVVLNSLLRYPSPPPSTYYFDLRCNPFSAYLLHLPNSNGPINQVHLLQLGTMPPSHDLRLWHQHLPWTIVVRSSHSNGILVSDILGNMYAQLMIPIVSQDYYNIDMTAEDRERVETAYKARCNGDMGLLRAGIMRIDFMGSNLGFLGLARSWNGMWEIRTVDIHDVETEP